MGESRFRGRTGLPLVASLAVVVAAVSWASTEKPARPKVLGISHVAFRVSSLTAARGFYEDFLGYKATSATAGKDGPEAPVLVPVNDRQYVELRPGLPPEDDRLDRATWRPVGWRSRRAS